MKKIGFIASGSTKGYKRYFTPGFIKKILDKFDIEILLEKNYGKDFNLTENDYKVGKKIKFESRQNILLSSDIILTVVCPSDVDLKLLHKGQLLIAMLHYSTHPQRNKYLKHNKIKTISLDSLKDFEGRRMVEDFEATAWNSVTTAFAQLRTQLGEKQWNDPKRKPIMVYQLGVGEVGKHVLEASLKMGRTTYQKELLERGGNPLVEIMVITSLHSQHKEFEKETPKLLSKTNLLIDVTQRNDVSETIISEKLISYLPKNSIILDVSADKYDSNKVVKAIQGIPTGDGSKILFNIKDASWTNDRIIPFKYQLKKENRRTVISNYSWPNCGNIKRRMMTMEKYGYQIYPVLKSIVNSKTLKLNNQGSDFWDINKAVYESTLDYYFQH